MFEKTIIEVDGMTCSSCAQGISRQLTRKGLKEVEVDFEGGTVEVNLEDRFSTREVIDAIQQLGYTARLQGSPISTPSRLLVWFGKTESRFLLALICTVPLQLHMFIHLSVLQLPVVKLLVCLPVFLVGWLHFGRSAWGSVRAGQPNMDVLIIMGSGAAFFYSFYGTFRYGNTPEAHQFLFYETSATIITLLLLGNIIEKRSLRQTQRAVEALTRMQPLVAHKIEQAMTPAEQTRTIDADQLRVQDLILIRQGERVPADGLVYEGAGLMDEQMMTGESLPVTKTAAQEVMAGTILAEGTLKVIVQRVSKDTILSKMIETVRKSVSRKPSIQRTGDRVSAVFVPAVVVIAMAVFLFHLYFTALPVSDALLRSIAVLVISCPCAMGLATPTAVAVGIGRSARNGILIKGGDTLERLSQVQTVVFDKTGTLTTGNIRIKEEKFFGDPDFAMALTGILEQYSSHPYAKLLKEKYAGITLTRPVSFREIKEIPGMGVRAVGKADGLTYSIGAVSFTQPAGETEGFQVFLTAGGDTLAAWSFEDTLRPEAKEVIEQLKQSGVQTVLLSGDSMQTCIEIARQVGIDTVHAEKLPDQKAEMIHALAARTRVAMVGDGINDAAALAAATVGVAMGSGADISIKTAEIVLLGNKDLHALIAAKKMAAYTLTTIRQNLFWALAYNVVAIPLAAMGYLSPLLASLSMAFSDVVVIGNSLRLHFRKIPGIS